MPGISAASLDINALGDDGRSSDISRRYNRNHPGHQVPHDPPNMSQTHGDVHHNHTHRNAGIPDSNVERDGEDNDADSGETGGDSVRLSPVSAGIESDNEAYGGGKEAERTGTGIDDHDPPNPPVHFPFDRHPIFHQYMSLAQSPTPSPSASTTSERTLRDIIGLRNSRSAEVQAALESTEVSLENANGHGRQGSLASWEDLGDGESVGKPDFAHSISGGFGRLKLGHHNRSFPSLFLGTGRSEEAEGQGSDRAKERESEDEVNGGTTAISSKLDLADKFKPRLRTLDRIVSASKSFSRLGPAFETAPEQPSAIASDSWTGVRDKAQEGRTAWFGGQRRKSQLALKGELREHGLGSTVAPDIEGKREDPRDNAPASIEVTDVHFDPSSVGDASPVPVFEGARPPANAAMASSQITARPYIIKLELPHGTVFTECRQWYVPGSPAGQNNIATVGFGLDNRGADQSVAGPSNYSAAPQLRPFAFQAQFESDSAHQERSLESHSDV